MGKLRYTKEEMEEVILIQLANLDSLGEQNRLLKEQNELLVKLNHKIIEEVCEDKKKIVPYPNLRKKPTKRGK